MRSKIVSEFQDSRFDVVEATQEGLILAMVEQLKKNKINFLQEEYASDSPTRQEADIGNVDAPIHFPNVIEKFQALIEELKNHNLVATQHFEERMAAQTKALANQVKIMAEKTKSMVDHA